MEDLPPHITIAPALYLSSQNPHSLQEQLAKSHYRLLWAVCDEAAALSLSRYPKEQLPGGITCPSPVQVISPAPGPCQQNRRSARGKLALTSFMRKREF
ncbi:hypothetical protein QQF64_017074 [Cirrhinus molitorella]|uniref:Uncharacterized protein n=1 Tax=Cirrhinus molitorella TaxID=172907 RepID=A0ABR3LHN0_9TELE